MLILKCNCHRIFRAWRLNEGFKFNNPNVKDECGCGESFNV